MKIVKETVFTVSKDELCRIIGKFITANSVSYPDCKITDLSLSEDGDLEKITFKNIEETTI